MIENFIKRSAIASAVVAFLMVTIVQSDEPEKAGVAPPAGTQLVGKGKLSIEIARERATVTQEIYEATLRMLHHRYFQHDKKLLPARAMQDIFADIESQSHVKARWISASFEPMSIDHTPKTDFERRAAKEIADGTTNLELVEGDLYHRAVAIPLTGGCLGCHEGMFQKSKRKNFAGLIVSIPLQPGQTESKKD